MKDAFDSAYIIGDQLGEGAFGQVRAAVHKETQHQCAVKIVELRGDPTSSKVDKKLVKVSDNEEMLMRKVQGSDNCIKLITAFKFECLHVIVMERCVDSLANRQHTFSSLSRTEISRIFREMTIGLAHVHACGIVHRDVKPANFLFGGVEGETLKLCDFGLSAEMPRGDELKGLVGTLPYMSPEVVGGKVGYDFKADIWSLGASMHVVLLGCYPYQPINPTRERMTQSIISGIPTLAFTNANGIIPETLPDGAVALLRDVLRRNATSRFSAEEILKLSFLQRSISEPTEPPAYKSRRQRPGPCSEIANEAPAGRVSVQDVRLQFSARSSITASTDVGASPLVSSGSSARTSNWRTAQAADIMLEGMLSL